MHYSRNRLQPTPAFAVMLAGFCCLAIISRPALGGNLSLGKPYSLAPIPSYAHCTDPGDAVQLTDGKVFTPGSAESFWTWKGTVGWHISSYMMIVVDLQKRCRIDRISYSTAGGGHAGVYYPARSEFYVSENGVDYTLVRTLTPAGEKVEAPPRHAERHTFSAEGINRTGRYVMLGLLRDKGGYTFTDEVTVFGEVVTDQAEKLPPPDATANVANHYLTRVTRSRDSGEPVVALVVDRRTHMRCNLRRVEKAIAQALPAGAKATSAQEAVRQALKAQIDSLKASMSADPDEAEWRTFITATLAMYARAQAIPFAGEGYLVWDKPMWDPLNPSEMPRPDAPPLERIDIRAVGNEYESACVTVSNVSDIPLELRVEPPMLFRADSGVTGPPVGPYIDRVTGPPVPQVAGGPDGWVTLRQVAFAETGWGMHGDALPELAEASLFVVPPMSTGQLWLTIRTRDVPAGDYTATLKMKPVRTALFEAATVKVNLTVLNTRLEGAPPLRTCGWGYPRFTEIVGHDQTAVKDQLDHYMDAFIVEVWLCGSFGVYGSDGSVVTPMNYEKLDRYLDLYKNGRLLLIYTSGLPGVSVKGADGVKSVNWNQPGWDAAFQSWYRQLVKHLLERGLTYDDFAFYPVDEPWTPEAGKEYVHIARAAKRADAKARIFVTAPGVPLDRLQTWMDCTDIFCLGGPDEDPKARALIEKGCEVWYYGGAAGKSEHPIAVARRNFWRDFDLRLTGRAVWDYCCSGWQKTGEETAWTELDTGGRGDASMIYRGKYGPVTTKRWEAWRDGVEDHWLLSILQKAHSQGRTKVDPRALAADAVRRPPKKEKVVMDPLLMALYSDTDPSDIGRILAARKAMLDALAKLE